MRWWAGLVAVSLVSGCFGAPEAEPPGDPVAVDVREPVADEPVADEPEPGDPAAEEPMTDEALAEEPVAEEPEPQEPVAEEPEPEEPKTEEPKTEEPKTEEPVAEEPKTEEPVAEEPVAEEPVAEEPAPNPVPRTYTLTTRGAFVGVIVRYDRNALIKGHDHVLVARKHTGKVRWTVGDPTACDIEVTVPVSSLVVDPPGSRKRQGFEGETSDGDKKTILKNALGKSQLNASAHPNITFKSTSCQAKGDKVKVNGTLTLRGVGKPVSTTMRIKANETSFSASGSLSFSHTQFGFKPFTAALGALKNADRLTLDLSFKGAP